MLEEYATNAVSRPCLILAHPNAAYEAAVALGFRRLGWDVYQARSASEVRRLARMLEADVAILDAELPEESGWLTSEKLTREHPLLKVILVTDEPGPRNYHLASFVGARALVGQSDGLAPLIEELCAPAAQAAS